MIEKYSNEKINSLEYMILVIFLSRCFYNGIGFQTMLKISKYDTWISLLLGFILGFIPILILMYINKKGINLFEIIRSKIIKFIIILFMTFSFTIILNDFINFASLKYLFETSNLAIALLFIIPAIYIVYKGIETIGRSALFMFYISVILFFLNSLALVKYIELDNLKPLFISGIFPIIKSSIHFIAYSIFPILFLSIVPKNNESSKVYNKKLIIGYIISSFSVIVILFFVTTVFNYQYTSLFNYPVYFILKKVEYEFLSNAENILSLFFIIDYFFTILTYMYVIKYYLKEELNLKDKKLNIIFILINIFVVYISVYGYKNIILLHYITNDILFYILLSFVILFLSIIPFIVKKKDNVKQINMYTFKTSK